MEKEKNSTRGIARLPGAYFEPIHFNVAIRGNYSIWLE